MNCRSARSSVIVAVISVIVLAGCTSEKPATVKQKAAAPVTVVTTVTESAESPTDMAESSAPQSTAPQSTAPQTSAPIAPDSPQLGDLVTVADWDVKITGINFNAAAQIHAANEFNDRPKGQFVLVTYAATYTGHARTADAFSDLTWSFTTKDSQIHQAKSEVTPADNQEWPTEARSGGTVRGQQVWDLQKDLIKGGILTVEGYTKNYNTVYADFPVDSLA
jgi:hypothetical protein